MSLDSTMFLANVVLVARADGSLTPNELALIEKVRREMGFKKSDLNAAIKLVDQGGHTVRPPGGFVACVRNLECILRVAMADGDLDTAERDMLVALGGDAGVSPDQLARMEEEVLAGMTGAGQRCPSCGNECDSVSRFCPKCGASLDDKAAAVQVEFTIPTKGFAVEFAESAAAAFPEALRIAQAIPGLQTCVRGKKTWYMVLFPSGSVEAALPLAGALSGIRNRKLYVDGAETPWDQVFSFLWCARRRDAAFNPFEYCFGKDEKRLNCWGCKMAQMDWTEWASWFSFGQWEKTGFLAKKVVWRFDKERIRHDLATNLFNFRFCPYLRPGLPPKALELLPETISPEDDANWAYNRIYEEVPGALKVVQREVSDGIEYRSEFWSDGVRPKGIKVYADLLTRAASALGEPTGQIKALLK